MAGDEVCEVPPESTTKASVLSGSGYLLTGLQIRMARAALRWSAEDLASKCGFAYTTVWRAESTNEIPNMSARNLKKIKDVLENEGGLVFFDGEIAGLKGAGPGVRAKE